jgi:ADP-glucose pyrophosphorylase
LPFHLEAADNKRDVDITVAARPMDEICETAFGLIKSNREGRIIKFAEKPK